MDQSNSTCGPVDHITSAPFRCLVNLFLASSLHPVALDRERCCTYLIHLRSCSIRWSILVPKLILLTSTSLPCAFQAFRSSFSLLTSYLRIPILGLIHITKYLTFILASKCRPRQVLLLTTALPHREAKKSSTRTIQKCPSISPNERDATPLSHYERSDILVDVLVTLPTPRQPRSKSSVLKAQMLDHLPLCITPVPS